MSIRFGPIARPRRPDVVEAQGRYDALMANVEDKLRGGRTKAYLGSYIGAYRPAAGDGS